MTAIPKISIIVPVYNVELYLRKCIESILAQTFTNFECILVDDGSPDKCPAICDEYALKDHRIIVIHQKNTGVSAARNAGLGIAKGEWIGFVDSDDWCDPGMFEYLLENAENNHADISICGYRLMEGDKIIRTTEKHPQLILGGKEAIKKLCLDKYMTAYSCNKLIKKQLLSYKNEVLRYDETIHRAEDRLFLFCLFKRAHKIVYFPKPYYNYYRHENSVVSIHEKKGVTTTSMTKFDALKKMLALESDKSIRRRIFAYEGIFAASSCLRYINYNGFVYDENFQLLKNIVKKNILYISMFGTIKQKIYSHLVFFPFAFRLYCWLKRGKG